MRKISSQIPIGVMCAILGFTAMYQFKSVDSKNISDLSLEDKQEVILELDRLKKEKDELFEKNEELSKKLDEIEKSAVDKGNLDKITKESLDKTRRILGQDETRGEGIKISLTLKSPLVIGQNPNLIKEHELTHIINLLNFSGAEAISINDFRITQQTGIKNASNFIWIGEEGRLSSIKPIEIKVIGNINNLKKGITFPGELEFGSLINYDYTIDEVLDLKIEKSNASLKSDYLKKSEGE